MLKRLGKTITNNFSLKILAVILAVVLWVVVIKIGRASCRERV